MKYTNTFFSFLKICAMALLFVVGMNTAHAQATTTPGVPTTGAGGDVFANTAVLVSSALVVIGGVWYIQKVRIS